MASITNWQNSPSQCIDFAYVYERYICPHIVTNMGVFGRTSNQIEETPCSYYPQIPGFTDVCELTEENYGQPWYCGKPRYIYYMCTTFSYIGVMSRVLESYRLSALSSCIVTFALYGRGYTHVLF